MGCQRAKNSVISWSEELKGNGEEIKENKKSYHIWEKECYHIWKKNNQGDCWEFCFLKPGKEYFDRDDSHRFRYDNKIINYNKEDMKPMLIHNGLFVEHNPEFNHFYDFVDKLHNEGKDTILTRIGNFLLRDAFYLEHRELSYGIVHTKGIVPDTEIIVIKGYFFMPNPSLIYEITKEVPHFVIEDEKYKEEIDTEAYLHYIDGIAQNEAVKYHHKVKNNDVMDAVVDGAGRENCLLTLINYIESRKQDNNRLCVKIRNRSNSYSADRGVLPIEQEELSARGYNL